MSAHKHKKSREKVKSDHNVHTSIWVPGYLYNKMVDELDEGSSESIGEVVRKALRERYKEPTAW